MNIGVRKVAMATPSDVSELANSSWRAVDPASIVALIGKTEGNGGANDFTRGYATLSYQPLLAPHLNITPEDVAPRLPSCGRAAPRRALAARNGVHAHRGEPRRVAPARNGDRDHARHLAGRGRHHGPGARGCERQALALKSRHRRPARRALRPGERSPAHAGYHRGCRRARESSSPAIRTAPSLTRAVRPRLASRSAWGGQGNRPVGRVIAGT